MKSNTCKAMTALIALLLLQAQVPAHAVKTLPSDNKIAACYADPMRVIKNNTVQIFGQPTRLPINLPKDLYPASDLSPYFKTVSGTARVRLISKTAKAQTPESARSGCTETNLQFSGDGQIELRVKGATQSIPDYFVRFVIDPQ